MAQPVKYRETAAERRAARVAALRKMSQADFEVLSGRRRATLRESAARYNGPWGNAPVDLESVVHWFFDFLAKYGARLTRLMDEGEDLITADTSSPELRRLRSARASIAEFELRERRGELLPSTVIRDGLQAFAHRMRAFSKVLEQQRNTELMDLFDHVTDDALKSMIEVLNSAEEHRS